MNREINLYNFKYLKKRRRRQLYVFDKVRTEEKSKKSKIYFPVYPICIPTYCLYIRLPRAGCEPDT